ncbi:MAG TPA: rod shape-determining protein MreC, partial [Clostridia bacterium]|nr:rod shape-determining protein MreC [Clostridia bacterium]
LATGIKDRFEAIGSYTDLINENKRLKEEVDKLQGYKNRNEQLETENQELRALLELKDYYQEYDLIAANIIAKDVTDWYNEFTLDAGTQEGVYIGCPVITSKGLVGIVSKVSAHTCKVMTLVDEQNVIMARISRSNELVRLRGMTPENYEYLLKLDRISASSDLYVGDLLVTAESGGVYPKGIAIGTVIEISTIAETETRYAIVEPLVNLPKISEVYILSLPEKARITEDKE